MRTVAAVIVLNLRDTGVFTVQDKEQDLLLYYAFKSDFL